MSTTIDKAALKKSVANLLNPEKPVEVRAKMFTHMLLGSLAHPEQVEQLLREFLELNQASSEQANFAALQAEYEQAMEELRNGPPRPATFIGPADAKMPGPQPRAQVVSSDGQERFPFLQEDVSLIDLQPGDTVFLDTKGATILGNSPCYSRAGMEAEFLRALPEAGCVEVVHQEQRYVLYASQRLLDAIAAGQVKRNDRVLWNQRMQFAFEAIPADADRKFRFVDDSRIPDIDIRRDIGKPHPILRRLIHRTRILLTRPDLMQRFDIRPRYSVFFTGPSGTGKTLTIKAYLCAFQKMLREVTGRDDLGSRVIRVKASTLLSEWFGVAERKVDQLFDDILALASQEFMVDGELRKLPVVVILEEAEGIVRKRSGGDGRAGMDVDPLSRVLASFLQRADDPNDDLSRLPLIWISSTNLAPAVDSAAWRRLANERADFKRLDREGCVAVLSKKLRPNYPYTGCNGTSPEVLRQQTIQQVVSWLYGLNGDDSGQLEITYRDGKKHIHYRRDFLTGSLIEQAVSMAVSAAAEECEQTGDDEVGIDADRITECLTSIVDAVADNVTAYNAGDYIDIPENAHIATVRRLRTVNRRTARMAN